ncbi:unnamed protein product, partial [Pylaiella littoralis]
MQNGQQQQQQQQRMGSTATPAFRVSRSARTRRPTGVGNRGRDNASRGESGATPSSKSSSKALQWAKAVCTKAVVCKATCSSTRHPRMFSNPPQRHGCSGDSSGARIGRGDQSVVATSVDVGPHQRGACNGSSSGIVEDDGGRRVAGGIPLETKDSSSRKNQKVDDGNGRVEHDVDDCGRSVKGARDTIAGRARDRVEDGGDDHCRLRRDRRTRTSSEGGGAGIGSGTSGVVGAGDIDGAEYVEVVVDPGNAAASGVAGGFSADDHDDGYSDASFAPDDDS